MNISVSETEKVRSKRFFLVIGLIITLSTVMMSCQNPHRDWTLYAGIILSGLFFLSIGIGSNSNITGGLLTITIVCFTLAITS